MSASANGLDSRRSGDPIWLVLCCSAIVLLAMIAAVSTGGRTLAMAGTVVVCGVAASLYYPSFPLWLMLATTFFYVDLSGISRVLPFWYRYIQTVGVALTLLAAAVRAPSVRLETWILRPLMAFVAVACVSAVVNGAEAVKLAESIAIYLRYPVFFIALTGLRLPVHTYKRLLFAFVVLSVVQVPWVAIAYAHGVRGDDVGGSMGGMQPLMIAMIVTQCLVMAAIVLDRLTFARAMLLPLLITPILFGEVIAGLLFSPLAMGYVALGRARALLYKLRPRRILLIGCIWVVVVAGVLSVTPKLSQILADVPGATGPSTDPGSISGSSLGRFTIIPFAFRVLMRNPGDVLVGFGPEAAYGGLLGDAAGVIWRPLEDAGLSSHRTTDVFRMLMEYGVLGLCCYGILLLTVWRHVVRQTAVFTDLHWRVFTLAFRGVALMFIVFLPFYIDAWRLDTPSFLFWLWAAALLSAARVQQGRLPRLAVVERAANTHLLDGQPASV